MRVVTKEGTTSEVYAAATASEMGGLGERYRYDAMERLAKLIDGEAGDSREAVVTPDTALGVSAVYSCVTLVSQQLGTMPLQTFEEAADGSVRRVRDGQADMLEYQPNPDTSASVFWTTATSHIMLRGNTYIAKIRDAHGIVRELRLLHPDRVVPWRDSDGRKWFQVTGRDGQVAHYSAYYIRHIPGQSFATGLEGHSVIDVMRRRIQASLATTEQQAIMFERGLNIKGVMKVPYGLDAQGEQAKGLRQDIRTFYSGTSNAGSVLLLEEGSEFQPISMKPVDVEFVQMMQFSATEVCSWFHVPPAEIGADSGGSLRYETTQGNDLNLLKKAVRFPKRRIEDDLFIDPDLFGLGCGRFARFNVDALLEVDINTRLDSYQKGYDVGLYSPDDIAVIEGREPKGDDVSALTKPQLDLALAKAKTNPQRNGAATQ